MADPLAWLSSLFGGQQVQPLPGLTQTGQNLPAPAAPMPQALANNPYLMASMLGGMSPGSPQYQAQAAKVAQALQTQQRNAALQGIVSGSLASLAARAPNGYPAPAMMALNAGMQAQQRAQAQAKMSAARQGMMLMKAQQAGTQQALAQQKLQSNASLMQYMQRIAGIATANPKVATTLMQRMGGQQLYEGLMMQAQAEMKTNPQLGKALQMAAMIAPTDPKGAALEASRVYGKEIPKALTPLQQENLQANIKEKTALAGYAGTARTRAEQSMAQSRQAQTFQHNQTLIGNRTNAILNPLIPNPKNPLSMTIMPDMDVVLAPSLVRDQVAHQLSQEPGYRGSPVPPATDPSGHPLPTRQQIAMAIEANPNSPKAQALMNHKPFKFDGYWYRWTGQVLIPVTPPTP